MPEGFTHIPNDELPEVNPVAAEAPKKPEAIDRFKNFLGDIFRPKNTLESEDTEEDEDDEATKKKKGRFARIWRNLFPSVASKEVVGEEAPGVPRRSLFFETGPAVDTVTEQPAIEAAPVAVTAEAVAERVPNTVQPIDTVELNAAPPTPEADTPQPEVELPEPVDEAEQAPDTLANEPAPTPEADTPPVGEEDPLTAPDTAVNTVVPVDAEHTRDPANGNMPQQTERIIHTQDRRFFGGLALAERERLRRMERREKDMERDIRHIKRELKEAKNATPVAPERASMQRPNVIDRMQPPVTPRTPETAAAAVVRSPERITVPAQKLAETIRVQKAEAVTTKAEQQKTLETLREQTNTLNQRTEVYKESEKQAIIESILKTPEQYEDAETNEIAHELSHEAKDLDKHSAAAWAAIQASAEAQAKANAAAIAAAQAAVSDQAAAIKEIASTQKAAMYQQAALGGFVAAVVIIAIIIVMFLLK